MAHVGQVAFSLFFLKLFSFPGFNSCIFFIIHLSFSLKTRELLDEVSNQLASVFSHKESD